jgi:molybdopterin synthase catalytic subunit
MLVRLVEGAIDEAEAARFVEKPGNGAVLVFRGIVRDLHAGRAVVRIDYHAYREMAEAELRRVAAETVERFGVPDLALVHRIGVVEVGQASLVVAVGAPHRRPAFDAALHLVDELKRRVPIWKKEYGPDGGFWVEGVRPPEPAPSVPEG